MDESSAIRAADLTSEVQRLAKTYEPELIAFRRDLHAHPELARAEVRTTKVLARRLEAAGLKPTPLPSGTGLICDIGSGSDRIALRADLDALPIVDEKDTDYRSTVPGVCHACGHDVHTAVVLGAGLVLADLAREDRLPRPVRLIFQPAEEVMPGGALDVLAADGLQDVSRIYCVHCDPRLDVGMVGLAAGPITSASDRVIVRLAGRGGHTSRPHLTGDLIQALGTLITELPAILHRRIDPRSGVSLVWGRVSAGRIANAIPSRGEIEGTLRCLDLGGWRLAGELIPELARGIVAPYDIEAEVVVQRGVPPVVNDEAATAALQTAAIAALGPEAVSTTEQSLGGEDFGWYLEHVPGALARLGVRRPGDPAHSDLHQGTFDPDERAIDTGVRLLATAVLTNRDM